jgi:hypothetical protein
LPLALIADLLRGPVIIIKLVPDETSLLRKRDLAVASGVALNVDCFREIPRFLDRESLEESAHGRAQWSHPLRMAGEDRQDSERHLMPGRHQSFAQVEQRIEALIQLLRDLLLDFELAHFRSVMQNHAGKEAFPLEMFDELVELLFPLGINGVRIRRDLLERLSWLHQDH